MLYEVITRPPCCWSIVLLLNAFSPRAAMTYVVTESCIKCKYTDCVDVCPVDCFREGPNMLVIDPEECIVITSYSIHYTKLYEYSSHEPIQAVPLGAVPWSADIGELVPARSRGVEFVFGAALNQHDRTGVGPGRIIGPRDQIGMVAERRALRDAEKASYNFV